jgi:histidinol-phosphate phosphatase family protein
MPHTPRQAVILAGGRGSRLRPLTDTVPKPMIPFHGRPFLEYLVDLLREQGIARILLLLGYLPEAIINHFGDGSQFGVSIEYDISAPENETGTRLRLARARIDPTFLFLYCDNYLPFDLAELAARYERRDLAGLITVYTNQDGYTRDNVRVHDGLVRQYDKSRVNQGLAGVDVGFALFDRSVLDHIPSDGNPSFEATVYPGLVQSGLLGALLTDHRYYSVGSPERLPLTDEFLLRRKAILVDRDGTLNVRMDRAEYVCSWEDWRWIPGTREALAALTAAGYRIVVITNQPGVARGALTRPQLDVLHDRMRAEAAAAGACIDAVLVCPHGWDEACSCRKPAPGLLFEAQRRFSLDLTRTPFIGDDDRDGIAAQAARSPFLRVSEAAPFTCVVHGLLKGERPLANVS